MARATYPPLRVLEESWYSSTTTRNTANTNDGLCTNSYDIPKVHTMLLGAGNPCLSMACERTSSSVSRSSGEQEAPTSTGLRSKTAGVQYYRVYFWFQAVKKGMNVFYIGYYREYIKRAFPVLPTKKLVSSRRHVLGLGFRGVLPQ